MGVARESETCALSRRAGGTATTHLTIGPNPAYGATRRADGQATHQPRATPMCSHPNAELRAEVVRHARPAALPDAPPTETETRAERETWSELMRVTS
jgi:hypothetical protein